MRLIDADALLEELKKTYKYFDLKFYIEEAPTIKPSGDSGVFIPDISVEQLRNAPLEGVEELLAEGVMRDVLEPSGDLISRDEAIAYIDRVTNSGLGKYKSLEYIRKYISALPSADRPTLKQTDTMIIADALRYLIKDTERHELDRTRAEELREQILKYGASMCHQPTDHKSIQPSGWNRKSESLRNCTDLKASATTSQSHTYPKQARNEWSTARTVYIQDNQRKNCSSAKTDSECPAG